MSAPRTVGWVLDKDTSRRRIHVHLLLGATAIGLTVETGERGGHMVVLDVEGATYLRGLLGEAVRRLEHAPSEKEHTSAASQ